MMISKNQSLVLFVHTAVLFKIFGRQTASGWMRSFQFSAFDFSKRAVVDVRLSITFSFFSSMIIMEPPEIA
jgi:hypothetical protein